MNILNLYDVIYQQINEYMDISSFQNFAICIFLQNKDKHLSREYKKKFLEKKEIIIRNSFHEFLLDIFTIETLLLFPIKTTYSFDLYHRNENYLKAFYIHFYVKKSINSNILRMIIFLNSGYLNKNIIEIYTSKVRKDTHYREILDGEIKDIYNRGFLIYNHNKLGPFTNLKYLRKRNFLYQNLSINFQKKLFLLSPLEKHFSLM